MFQILLALADGEKHGYAILKEVARRTDDKVRLSAGTLYGNLARLESAGETATIFEIEVPKGAKIKSGEAAALIVVQPNSPTNSVFLNT